MLPNRLLSSKVYLAVCESRKCQALHPTFHTAHLLGQYSQDVIWKVAFFNVSLSASCCAVAVHKHFLLISGYLISLELMLSRGTDNMMVLSQRHTW